MYTPHRQRLFASSAWLLPPEIHPDLAVEAQAMILDDRRGNAADLPRSSHAKGVCVLSIQAIYRTAEMLPP
jgi:hypothetical protein